MSTDHGLPIAIRIGRSTANTEKGQVVFAVVCGPDGYRK